MRPRTALLVGLVFGGLLGLGCLTLGTLALFPGLVVWAWLLRQRPRLPAAAGGLIVSGDLAAPHRACKTGPARPIRRASN